MTNFDRYCKEHDIRTYTGEALDRAKYHYLSLHKRTGLIDMDFKVLKDTIIYTQHFTKYNYAVACWRHFISTQQGNCTLYHRHEKKRNVVVLTKEYNKGE